MGLYSIIKQTYKFTKNITNYVWKQSYVTKRLIKPYSNKGIKWVEYRSKIDGVFIQHAENGGEFCIPKTRFKADGFAPLTNTVYEFDGCIFHGCKKCYDRNFVNYLNNKTMKELYEKTAFKEKEIKKLGYNVVRIWEHEWDEMCKKGQDKVTWGQYGRGLVYGLFKRIF